MHMSTQGAILCILWAPAPGKTQGISLDPLLAARMIHLTRGHEWYTHRYLPLQPLDHAILIRLLGIKYVRIYSCNKGQSHLIFVVPRCYPEGIYVSQACLQASWKYGHFSYQRSNGHNGHIVTVWNSEYEMLCIFCISHLFLIPQSDETDCTSPFSLSNKA